MTGSSQDVVELAGQATRLAEGAAAGEVLPGSGVFARFQEVLASETRLPPLIRIWQAGREQAIEPEFVLFATLKRLRELVEPDPYLELELHALARWSEAATVEETEQYLEAALALAPSDPYVLWEELASWQGGGATQRRILDRLAALGSEPALVQALMEDLRRTPERLSTDAYNQLARTMPRVGQRPVDELARRLVPRSG